MEPVILTIKEVSNYLRLNEKTTYRLTADGKIPAFKVGGSWRFRKEEIDTWIDNQISQNTEGQH